MTDHDQTTPVTDGPIIGWYEPSCLRCFGDIRGNHCTRCGYPAFTSKEHHNG